MNSETVSSHKPFTTSSSHGTFAGKQFHSERSLQAVIANITQQSYMAHRTYGTFQIPGRAAEAKNMRVSRGDAADRCDGLWRQANYPLAITAREIAEDLCREINSDAGENSFLGVFVCAGNVFLPEDGDFVAHRAALEDFYRAMVASADREWERSPLVSVQSPRPAAARGGAPGPQQGIGYYQVRETAECPRLR